MSGKITSGPIGEVINERPTQTNQLRPNRWASMPSDTYQTRPATTMIIKRNMATELVPSCCCSVTPRMINPTKQMIETVKLHTKLEDSKRVTGFWPIARPFLCVTTRIRQAEHHVTLPSNSNTACRGPISQEEAISKSQYSWITALKKPVTQIVFTQRVRAELGKSRIAVHRVSREGFSESGKARQRSR